MASTLELLTLAMLTKAPSVPIVTGSIASSAAEAVIGTFSITGNDITTVNAGYQFRIVGNADDTGTPTLTIRMRIGGLAGTQLSNQWPALTCRTTVTQMPWNIDGFLYFTATGASSQLQGHMVMDETFTATTPTLRGASTFLPSNPATFDNTVPWTLVVTAQWSASSASNVARTLTGALYKI